MSEGNWRLGLIVDEAASDEQAQALGRVFAGELGGPPAALGPLLGEFLGVERAPFDVQEDGHTHKAAIGELHVEVEDIVSFGVETGQPAQLDGIFHPAGSTLTIAKATHAHGNPFGIEYEGKSAFSKPDFSWAG
jgi:hypothetical protein